MLLMDLMVKKEELKNAEEYGGGALKASSKKVWSVPSLQKMEISKTLGGNGENENAFGGPSAEG